MATTTRYRRARIGRRTRATTYDASIRYNIEVTAVGKQLFARIGECIADGGYVQFKQWWEGMYEYADCTLTWSNKRAEAKRRRRGKRRKNN